MLCFFVTSTMEAAIILFSNMFRTDKSEQQILFSIDIRSQADITLRENDTKNAQQFGSISIHIFNQH